MEVRTETSRHVDNNYVEQITLLGIQLDIYGRHNSLQTGANTL